MTTIKRDHLELVASNGELLVPVVIEVKGFVRWFPPLMKRAEFKKGRDKDNEDDNQQVE